jgi:outer membrane protein assembly factor BamB
VIVGQGDGWLRSFDAATGKLLWRFDLNPKSAKWELGGAGTRSGVIATPVLHDGRVYIGPGQDAEHGDGPGCLYCIDPTKTGDVSRELDDGPGKGKPNPDSAAVWHTFGPFAGGVPGHNSKKNILEIRSDGYLFGRTISSCTVHDRLVYAADIAGFFFCFDARTGKPYWIHDLKSQVYGQPLWADGRVLVATEDGDIWVFAHGKDKKQLAKVEGPQPVRPGLVFANQTLYVAGERTLFAIRTPK